jgi:hypothetical protein
MAGPNPFPANEAIEPASIPPADVASYVAEILRGIRQLTNSASQLELASLDRLLAMGEHEARKVAFKNR